LNGVAPGTYLLRTIIPTTWPYLAGFVSERQVRGQAGELGVRPRDSRAVKRRRGMLEAGILLFVVTVFVVLPLVQRSREAKLARRLEETRDPLKAALLVDAAVAADQRDGEAFKTARDRAWPFLFRW
jgi:hypothetical protein